MAALLILPNLGKGWEALKYWIDSVPTAYAGKAKAEEVRSDFDQYIAQRQEELKLEKQRNELQENYNKKLLDIQQQQAPNQADTPEVWWAQDEDGAWYCTDGRESWWPTQEGTCD